MKYSQGVQITQYDNLIQKINPLGKFQIKLYLICILNWCFAGCTKTIFDLAFQEFSCPYALVFSEFSGILILCQISCRIGYVKAGLFGGILSLCGLVLIIIQLLTKINIIGQLGIIILSLNTFSRPVLMFCNIAEYTTIKIIHILIPTSILFYSIFKFLTVFLIDSISPLTPEGNVQNLYVMLQLLLPVILLSFLLWFFVSNSPRYLIENNINDAQKLLRKISQINNIQVQNVINYLEDSFAIRLINIRIYDYRVLYKYRSLGFYQYCLMIMMVLLGVVYDFPKRIMFQDESKISPIQIIWESSFQFVGIITTYLFIKIGKRRFYLGLLSIVLSATSTSMFIIQKCCNQQQILCKYLTFIALGLNSLFSIILFIFIMICAIEFYPHSIRVLGLGFIFSLFHFGKFLNDCFLFSDPLSSQKTQLFLMGSWVMALHSLRAPETFLKGFKYQIQEIQDDYNEDV